MTTATEALKEARMTLDSLGGLWVTDATEDNPHEEKWQIGTTKTVNKIEQTLAVLERDLSERIEAAYSEVIEQRKTMLDALGEIRRAEENAKVEHSEEWASAKNNDVRKVLLAEWLSHDDPYIQARIAYEGARDSFRLELLEVERLRLLVELAKAGER